MDAMVDVLLVQVDVVRQVLADRALGTVHSVIAYMGERFTPDHRILRASLAAEPPYDLSTYPVLLATWGLRRSLQRWELATDRT
jgi:hypothetical protein